MVELKTPEAPATQRQLWLLHVLTGEDTRQLNLTMQQASDRIAALKQTTKRPLINPHATALQQDQQLRDQQKFDKEAKTKTKPKGRYYLMVCPRRKWLAFHFHSTTKHLRGIVKSQGYYYDRRAWAIVWAVDVRWARSMMIHYLKSGERKLIGQKTGRLYAELIEDTLSRL